MRICLIYIIFAALQLSYAVETSASPSQEMPTTSVADQPVKCRKILITGSLVKKLKVCKTAAEWRRIDDNGNRAARALAGSGEACSGGSCGDGNN
jgi:hypothetical protein